MFFETFVQDLRIGMRVLIKEKAFCALAVSVLALGIGAVTTQFSVVNGTLIRGFSFPNAERMMSVQFIDPSPANASPFGPPNQIFTLDYVEVAKNQKSFERMAGYIFGSTVNVTYQGVAQRYTGAYVTDEFFKIIGVAPMMGRDFTAADNQPGAEKTAIIGHDLWQHDFGGRADIVGTAIRVNGRSAVIIGVMPKGFSFPVNDQIWSPYFNEYPPTPRNDQTATSPTPAVMGLLRVGVSAEEATSEISTFAARFAKEFPDTNKQFSTGLVQPLIKTFTGPQLRVLLFSMLAACVLVLLLACANVMNMQFARATLRAKELAIRSSLGATRSRLVRQMLTESLLLASLGALIGVGIAEWATDLLLATARNLSNPIPGYITFPIDPMVLTFVVAITVLTAVISGVIPAWMAARADPSGVLKESGRGNTSRAINFVTRSLVIAQIVISCLILIYSLLQLQSIVRQQRVDYGYDTQAIATARMGVMDGEYPTAEKKRQFYDQLLIELRASPEIEAAALTNRRQMTFTNVGPSRIEIEGHKYVDDHDRPNVNNENVSEGYFEMLGMKVIEGRDFTKDDNDMKLPVAIVNAEFARKSFGTDSALGRRFRTVGNNGQLFGPWRTIVGVVSDVRMLGPFNNPGVENYGFYLPFYSNVFGPATGPQPVQFATIAVRPRGTPAAGFANNLRRIVSHVDPNLPLYFVGTAKENQESFLGQNRIIATMFSVFGLVATALASIGLYGVMSFSVNQRKQEFGIRLALGADQSRILGMVMRQGSMQLAIGLGLGVGLMLALSVVFASGIEAQLFRISARDPVTYLSVAVLLALVSSLATFVPARRATRVDPMVALRSE
ncbi:MAG TPA: ABC transporter permease [Candidatus Didemnitutus sp.]|nr:ABC transporter permease [Candidatus Didemnitutus sp.]